MFILSGLCTSSPNQHKNHIEQIHGLLSYVGLHWTHRKYSSSKQIQAEGYDMQRDGLENDKIC